MKLKAILIAMVFVSAITTKAQDVNWQARVGGGITCLFGGVSNINERTVFHVGGGPKNISAGVSLAYQF